MLLVRVYRVMDALGKFGEHPRGFSHALCPCASTTQYMHAKHEPSVKLIGKNRYVIISVSS